MAPSASKITGNTNEFTLRFPSVAAGLAGIILTYFLVLPYAGRRRALISGLMLGSMYGVFWCSRSAQMDILVLAADVIHRLATGELSRRLRRAGLAIHALPAFIFAVAGLALIFVIPSRYPEYQEYHSLAQVVGAVLLVCSAAVIAGIVLNRRMSGLAPAALGGAAITIYLIAVIWLLPMANPHKSARAMGNILKVEAASGTTIVSYRLWDWRAEYSYYGEQNIRILQDRLELMQFWDGAQPRLVLIEEGHLDEVRESLGRPASHQQIIGSRTVHLFSDHPLAGE